VEQEDGHEVTPMRRELFGLSNNREGKDQKG
jgi:hypothetical protein